MALKFVNSIDLNRSELQNAVLQKLGTAPADAVSGLMYFDSANNLPYWYNGKKWITFPSSADVDTLKSYFSNGVANDSAKLEGTSKSGLLTEFTSNTTDAIKITIGGKTEKIEVSVLQLSLGIKSLAYKDSLTETDIPTIGWSKIKDTPSTVEGYGITDAITTANISSQRVSFSTKAEQDAEGNEITATYLPFSGGTIDGNLYLKGGELAGLPTSGNTKYWEVSSVGAASFSDLTVNGKKIGSFAYKSSLGWSEITNRPTKLSDFTDDVVSGKYLLISGGTLTGNLTAPGIESTGDISANGSISSVNGGFNGNTLNISGEAIVSSIKIGSGTISWDSANNAFKFNKPIYSTGAISTKGIGSGSQGESSGGGGIVDLTAVNTNIVPSSNNLTIGSMNNKWDVIYSNKLYLGTTEIGNRVVGLSDDIAFLKTSFNNIDDTVSLINSTFASKDYVTTAINDVYSQILGGDDLADNLNSLKEILEYVQAIEGKGIVTKSTHDITGDGTKTSFSISHQHSSKDIMVYIYEKSSPYQQVYADVRMSGNSNITVLFSQAPKSGENYRVVIMS